jgi:hypothetical protein
MDAVLIRHYENGMQIDRICKKLETKFGIPRSTGSAQSRLGLLRDQGLLKKRPAGGDKRVAATGKKTSSNGAGKRVLSVDLGPKGSIRVEISGPIVLHTEAVSELTAAIGKLMVS